MLVYTSALAECFLRKLTKAGFIRYTEGAETITTRDDEADSPILKPLDPTTRARLEKVKGTQTHP
jgi:ribosome-binding ATPase